MNRCLLVHKHDLVDVVDAVSNVSVVLAQHEFCRFSNERNGYIGRDRRLVFRSRQDGLYGIDYDADVGPS